jgi:hypothetical protein
MLGTGPLVLTYSFKSLVRLFYYVTSSGWNRVTAFVTGQIVLDPAWGGASVKLHYKFESDGQWTKGWDTIPMLYPVDARDYSASFTHNMPRTIRVNPKNPRETRFFERDQKGGGQTT